MIIYNIEWLIWNGVDITQDASSESILCYWLISSINFICIHLIKLPIYTYILKYNLLYCTYIESTIFCHFYHICLKCEMMFYNVYPVYYINVMLLDAKRSVILNTIDHILLQINIFLLFFYFCKTRGMISAFSSYRYHNNYEIIMFMFICKQVFFQILSLHNIIMLCN